MGGGNSRSVSLRRGTIGYDTVKDFPKIKAEVL
jgi:hypothetical protein